MKSIRNDKIIDRRKVWITKYALTKGLFQVEAEIVDGVYASVGMLFTREWVETEEEAREKFEVMRKRKIERLRRATTKICEMQCKFATSWEGK